MEEDFQIPLQEMSILSPEEINKLFANTGTIRKLHEVLLEDLKKRLQTWTPGQRIGDIFLQLVPFMKLYEVYINNYNNAVAFLTSITQTRVRFHMFLKHVSEKGAGHSQLFLDNLLIVPVQRLPRYEMLLKELLKYTDKDHEDYETLSKAFEAVGSTIRLLNWKKKMQDDNVIRHHFVKCSLKSPTWCDFCGGFIWGVTKQAWKCESCEKVAHKQCQALSANQVGCTATSDQVDSPQRPRVLKHTWSYVD
eukprot:TRINITY_DN5740_c0_g1_i2.p1 TRINITY_DN5740_c0_g1~~TRINITY_DN5740_c0_g1_i2.p1  ORF type:complete len:250 (-),score=44.15 TRINITY_DN5740_c0_g1_i2:18-767(-)